MELRRPKFNIGEFVAVLPGYESGRIKAMAGCNNFYAYLVHLDDTNIRRVFIEDDLVSLKRKENEDDNQYSINR